MRKPFLIFSVFAAGVVVGALAMRTLDRPADAIAPVAVASAEASAPPSPTVVESHDSRSPAKPLSAVSVPSNSAAHSVTAPSSPELASSAPPTPATDAGAIAQPIDVGDAFSKMVARPSQPGFENQIGDAHRALEREMRDEGWAYTMEAELQNAMVNELSTGAFKAEHIECRTTMCEVRLSGTGPQAAAIKAWHDGLMGQPFGQRLFLNYGSSITNNDQTDMLMIFRKPPPPQQQQKTPQKVSQRRELPG